MHGSVWCVKLRCVAARLGEAVGSGCVTERCGTVSRVQAVPVRYGRARSVKAVPFGLGWSRSVKAVPFRLGKVCSGLVRCVGVRRSRCVGVGLVQVRRSRYGRARSGWLWFGGQLNS